MNSAVGVLVGSVMKNSKINFVPDHNFWQKCGRVAPKQAFKAFLGGGPLGPVWARIWSMILAASRNCVCTVRLKMLQKTFCFHAKTKSSRNGVLVDIFFPQPPATHPLAVSVSLGI